MSKIEWTRNDDGTEGKTWNPLAGCSVVSPGCTNCYAMRMAARIERMQPDGHYKGLTKRVNGNPVWTSKIARAPDKLFNAPLKWRKPTRVFVNSMSDLFHEAVADEWIDEIFKIMAQCPQHTFQILTKRPARMRAWCVKNAPVPYPQIWLGVSVEDQARADERIPLLLDTPAAVRFISAEPLLGPLDIAQYMHKRAGDGGAGLHPMWWAEKRLQWVIVGGESGPGKRPVNLGWMRDIRDQCKAASAPLFVKQIDKKIPIPDDLMIREYPVTDDAGLNVPPSINQQGESEP